MCQSGNVAEAKSFSAALAEGRGEHERGGDPRKTRKADFGKGGGQKQSRDDCQRIAMVRE